MAEMKQEDLPSQGQEAQEAPVKSEEEKPEGGAPPEPKAPHHPTGDDAQEGLPSQASASSNVAPAETKEENNQELPPTTPAGEGQPPKARAWENRKTPSRQPGKAQGKGEFLLERRTPAQRFVDDYTLQRQRNRPGKKARAQQQAAQSVPPMPPPAKRAAHPGWGHEEWEGWQRDEHWSGGWSSSWWEASREWDQAQSSGGDASETSPEPAPVEEQDQEDQEPPADLNTGTRPYNEGGNLIRGNGLTNQMPDQASYEVQGKIRYLTMLARGGSRVVYTLDREPRWVLKVGPQDAHHFRVGAVCAVPRLLAPGLPEVHPPGRGPWAPSPGPEGLHR